MRLSVDAIVNVGRGFLALSMMMTYPMECYVSRHCILSLLQEKQWEPLSDPPPASHTIEEGIEKARSESLDEIQDNGLYRPLHSDVPAGSAFCIDEELEATAEQPVKQRTHRSADKTGKRFTYSALHGTGGKAAEEEDEVEEVVLRGHDADPSAGRFSMDQGSEIAKGSTVWEDCWREYKDDVLRVLVTLVLWIIAVTIAICFGDVGVVLSLTGTHNHTLSCSPLHSLDRRLARCIHGGVHHPRSHHVQDRRTIAVSFVP